MMALGDALRAISDCGEWVHNGYNLVCDDGVVSWTVCDHGGSYTLAYERGWYKQVGDAADLQELVELSVAMLEAERALNESLRKARG